MRSVFRRSVVWSLAAASLLACAARAQEPRAPRRPSGPIAGPVITLPAGQGGTLAEPAAAEGEQAGRADGLPRWEYCAFTTTTTQKDRWSPVVGVARVRYRSGATEQVEGATEDEAALNAMNKLGDEGWELVAVRESIGLSDGFGSSTARYFFKRPRRSESEVGSEQ